MRSEGSVQLISHWITDFRGAHEVKVLGEGECGIVKLVEWRRGTNVEQIALKTFAQQGKVSKDISMAFFREVEILVRVLHPCILPIVGYSLQTESLPAQIGMRYAPNGSLREALIASQSGHAPFFMDDTGIAIIIIGVVVAMRYIHLKQVIHRDLKPENILLDEYGWAQIGDLGNSRFLDLGITISHMVGTSPYMAPEMYDDGDYTTAVDVYSFALILYELLVGQPVFSPGLGPTNIMRLAIQGERPEIPKGLNRTVAEIIRKCWDISPLNRYTFSEIFNLLADINFQITSKVQSAKVFDFLKLIGEAGKQQIGGDLSALLQENQRLQDQIARLESEIERQQWEITNLNTEVEQRRDFATLKSQNQRQHRELGSLRDENEQLRNTIARLEEENKRLQRKGKISDTEEQVSRSDVIIPTGQPVHSDLGMEFKVSPELKLVSKWKATNPDDKGPNVILNGIIAHLTNECGGNVHDHKVVKITTSSVWRDDSHYYGKRAADLNDVSVAASAWRPKEDNIPHARNNWLSYDFLRRKILPTHYAIRTYDSWVNCMRSWVVEVSMDGHKWTEIDHKEDNQDLKYKNVTRIFPVTKKEQCRFIRLVNIGRNWYGGDALVVSAWEIFGTILN